MHFVKYIEIHFSTKRASMVVAGAEAQKLFDAKAYHNDVVEITVDGKILAIPRPSIDFVAIYPHREANVLRHKINELAKDIAEEIIEDNQLEDYLCKVYEPDLWNRYDGEILEIGCYDDEADIPIYTRNPDIISKAEKLFALQDELEKTLAGDRNAN